MSRELVEAVVQAAKHHGVVAVLVSGENGNGHAPPSAALPPGAPADAVARFQAAQGRIAELEKQVQTSTSQIANLTTERDTYSARLREAEAKIRSGGAPAGGSPVPAAPNLDGQPISILGLDEEEIAKKVIKKGFDTVGKLRVALLEGKLASEVKLSKDRIISVGEALLGKTPPATLPGASGSAPVSSATPAAGVPAGHTDRPWTERLQAARKKERQWHDLANEIAELNGKLATTTDQVIRGQIDAEIRTKTGVLDVIRGQVFCLLWACGLYSTAPKNVRDLSTDGALKDAGLVHLMETPPTPADVPAQAPQQPPAPTA